MIYLNGAEEKHMNDFKNEQLKVEIEELIEELIDKVRKACFKTRNEIQCRFEFYMHSETKPLSSEANRNVEKVPALLEELKKCYSLAHEVKDTRKMSSKHVRQVYGSCANWASNPKRPYEISRMIYDIFAVGEAGDRFGKEIPVMIIYDLTGSILLVLPHIVKRKRFSLAERKGYQEKKTIPIYEFLTRLKDDLEKKS